MRITIRLSDELSDKLVRYASDNHVKTSDVVRQAIEVLLGASSDTPEAERVARAREVFYGAWSGTDASGVRTHVSNPKPAVGQGDGDASTPAQQRYAPLDE